MKKPLILVVDDDPSILTLIQVNLRVSGYDVATAASLGEAGRKTAELNPDLVVLDINLPDGSGFDFLAGLKGQRRTEGIPVLILTAMDERRGKISGFDLGADDYLTKPFDVTELELRVRAILRRASRERTMNPLTGLPGNSLIEEEMLRRLEGVRTRGFASLFIHINGFDALRESQGFLQGDQMVLDLGEAIQEAVRDKGGIDDFVGHRGDDDFVVITTAGRAEPLAKRVIEAFAASQGEGIRVSIGVVSSEGTDLRTTRDIGEAGAKARKLADGAESSSYTFYQGVDL